VTVLDTGVLIEYLLDQPTAPSVEALFDEEGELTAPDIVVFEAVAVLRRLALRRDLSEPMARGALADMADVPIELFPSLALRNRAWELKANLGAADGLFVALAERLNEPLLTKDSGLAAGASDAGSTAEVRLL
jgi:predicted nucleic acid-binding protein